MWITVDESVLNYDSECPCRGSRTPAVRARSSSSQRPVQALLDQRANLDTSALVRGKVAVGARKLSGPGRTVAARRDLLRAVGPLVSGFCVDGTGTPRHDVTGSVVGSGPKRSLRILVVHRSLAVSLQRFPLSSIETLLWRASALSILYACPSQHYIHRIQPAYLTLAAFSFCSAVSSTSPPCIVGRPLLRLAGMPVQRY